MGDVVKHLLILFQESPVWRNRALAADLLIVLGRGEKKERGGGGGRGTARFQESPVWRYRALPADLLIVLGRCLWVWERNRGGGDSSVPGISCLEVQGSRC